jgi:replicative DNA helicase
VSAETLPEPRDEQTERAVLGCVLAGVPVQDTGPLPVDCFTGTPRRHVWEAMLSLAVEGRAVDHITVASRLKDRGQLVGVGGPAALMALDAVPLAASCREYSGRLRELSARRAMVAAADAARAKAMDMSVPPTRGALEAAQAFAAVRMERPLVRGGRAVIRLAQRWQDFIDGKAEPYLTVPYAALNEAGFRGFVPNLNVLAGRSGNFKTGFATGCVTDWVFRQRLTGGVFGLEDGVEWVTDRPTAQHMGIAYGEVGASRLPGGDESTARYHEEKLQDWMSQLHAAYEERLFVYDVTDTGIDADTPSISFPDLLAEARRMIHHGARFILIDHGLRIEYPRSHREQREDQAIGKAMDALANLGMRTGVPIIMLWHLNRNSDDEAQPKRSDLKESGYLDAAARVILGLWRQQSRQGHQLVTAVKATKGKEGITAALEVDGPSGLLRASNGYVVDFEAERATAQEERSLRSTRRRPLFPTGGTA